MTKWRPPARADPPTSSLPRTTRCSAERCRRSSEGRYPQGPNEVALGAETAAALGAAVGDSVTVETLDGGEPMTLTVTRHRRGVGHARSRARLRRATGHVAGAAVRRRPARRVQPHGEPLRLGVRRRRPVPCSPTSGSSRSPCPPTCSASVRSARSRGCSPGSSACSPQRRCSTPCSRRCAAAGATWRSPGRSGSARAGPLLHWDGRRSSLLPSEAPPVCCSARSPGRRSGGSSLTTSA